MAVLQALPAPEIIMGLKGTLDYYLWRGKIVVRSWPRSPAFPRAPAVQDTGLVFADLVRALTSAPLIVQQTARELTKDQPLTWRDAVIMAAYNHLHTW